MRCSTTPWFAVRLPTHAHTVTASSATRAVRAALIDLLDSPAGADAHRVLEILAPQLGLPAERAAWRA